MSQSCKMTAINLTGDELINAYIESFSNYSFKNELYAQVSLHVLFGQAISQKVYYKMGARMIDLRTHMLLIKPQGTGKGAGYGFVSDMARRIGIGFSSLTESTDAGLIGTLERDGKENIVIPGLLQTTDLVGMEEASPLFDYNTEFSKKNMLYMQIAMNSLWGNSCYISKRLGSEMIEFKPHASLLLLTYPPDHLVDKLLKTGFIDRLVPIFEDVTLADRLEVIKIMSEKTVSYGDTKETAKGKEELVTQSLLRIINKYRKREALKRIYITDDIKTLMLQIIEEFSMKILDASPKAREKLQHFLNRLYETLLKLAIHHALLSGRENIEVKDIMYARLLYLPIWRNLIISIESLLIIDPHERARYHRIIRTAIEEYDRQIRKNKFVKEKDWVRRLTMLQTLQNKWDNCSLETADSNLKKIEKIPETTYEKFGKIAALEKDKFFERKYIGGVAYLKKIKDIK